MQKIEALSLDPGVVRALRSFDVVYVLELAQMTSNELSGLLPESGVQDIRIALGVSGLTLGAEVDTSSRDVVLFRRADRLGLSDWIADQLKSAWGVRFARHLVSLTRDELRYGFEPQQLDRIESALEELGLGLSMDLTKWFDNPAIALSPVRRSDQYSVNTLLDIPVAELALREALLGRLSARGVEYVGQLAAIPEWRFDSHLELQSDEAEELRAKLDALGLDDRGVGDWSPDLVRSYPRGYRVGQGLETLRVPVHLDRPEDVKDHALHLIRQGVRGLKGNTLGQVEFALGLLALSRFGFSFQLRGASNQPGTPTPRGHPAMYYVMGNLATAVSKTCGLSAKFTEAEVVAANLFAFWTELKSELSSSDVLRPRLVLNDQPLPVPLNELTRPMLMPLAEQLILHGDELSVPLILDGNNSDGTLGIEVVGTRGPG